MFYGPLVTKNQCKTSETNDEAAPGTAEKLQPVLDTRPRSNASGFIKNEAAANCKNKNEFGEGGHDEYEEEVGSGFMSLTVISVNEIPSSIAAYSFR